MKKDSGIKKDKKSPSQSSSLASKLADFVSKHVYSLAAGIALVTMLLFGYSFASNNASIKNLINSDEETLKNAIFHPDQPHLFYCSRAQGNSKKESDVPAIFTDLYKLRSAKYTFAKLNCSQLLPSGKNIYDRFKLKKEIRPTIFGSAPWTKVKQALPEHLKNAEALKKFVDTSFSPKATLVTSDKELRKACLGNVKNETSRDNLVINTESTCIVLLKGVKHGKTHADIEARLVRENPKLKVVLVDATKKRLSFENPDEMPADIFGLRVHAIRNMTHYISMVNPVTWDYLSTFVGHSAGSPLSAYSGSLQEPISLLKLSSPVFQRKSKSKQQRATAAVDVDDDDEGDDDQTATAAKKASSKKPHRKQSTTGSEEQSVPADDGEDRSKEGRAKRRQKARADRDRDRQRSESKADEDPEESAAERQERERIRREKMERQSRERLFDEDDEDSSNSRSSQQLNDDEDEIIEL
jgi:hypothetical protein